MLFSLSGFRHEIQILLCLLDTSNLTDSLRGRGFILTPPLESQTLGGLGCFSYGASAETGKVQRLHKCEVISSSRLSVGGFTVESVWMTKGNGANCQEGAPSLFLMDLFI